MRRKRTKAELNRLVSDFEGRAAWLESAWGCRTEYEVDLATGRLWLKVTMPASTTALVVRCDIEDLTLPGTDPRP
jgi:hypothetical protein